MTAPDVLVADLSEPHVGPLASALAGSYYIEKSAVRDAVRGREHRLEECPESRRFHVGSPEDVILHKLAWYRSEGEVSGRQWRDVLGVIEVQGASLDDAYLRRWATHLGVTDLLERALAEVG